MRRKRGQKRKRRAFQREAVHRSEMRRRRGGFLEKRSCHASVFLQLSKYEEDRPPRCHPLRRPVFRYWRRTAAANCTLAALRAPHGDGGGRDSGGAWDSRLDVVASPGEIAAGWIG